MFSEYLLFLSKRPRPLLLLGVAGPPSAAAAPSAAAHDEQLQQYLQEHFGRRALRKQVCEIGDTVDTEMEWNKA